VKELNNYEIHLFNFYNKVSIRRTIESKWCGN